MPRSLTPGIYPQDSLNLPWPPPASVFFLEAVESHRCPCLSLGLCVWPSGKPGQKARMSPRPALKDTLLCSFQLRSLYSQTGRALSRMGHCTASSLSPPAQPLWSLSANQTSVPLCLHFDLWARAVCSRWAVTLPPRMLLCIC